MAVDFTGRYLGNLKVEVTHGPSGTQLITVPPVDNQGDGSSFSPTDLVAAALGSCMLSLISIVGDPRRPRPDGPRLPRREAHGLEPAADRQPSR